MLKLRFELCFILQNEPRWTKTNPPKITSTKSPNMRAEPLKQSPLALCAVPLWDAVSEQELFLSSLFPNTSLRGHAAGKGQPWEAAGADRAVNSRHSLTGQGHEERWQTWAQGSAIEELRAAPTAASVHALLLIISGPNVLIPVQVKGHPYCDEYQIMESCRFYFRSWAAELGVEEQLLTRRKLGVGFCPIAGIGGSTGMAAGKLGEGVNVVGAGRRSKCGVAVALCSHSFWHSLWSLFKRLFQDVRL